MASEPSLVDELWESLVAVVIAAAVGLWWLLRRPWLLGAALIAVLVVARGGWLAGALVLGVVLAVLVAPAAVLAGVVCPLGVWAMATGADRRPVSPASGVG